MAVNLQKRIRELETKVAALARYVEAVDEGLQITEHEVKELQTLTKPLRPQ